MKKFILFAAFIVSMTAAVSVKAQMAVPKLLTTTSFGNTLDTVPGNAARVTTPADGLIRNWKTGVTALVVAKKISGTVAGTLVFQGSMDGVEWVTIGSAASVTDASNNYSFNTTVRFYYYRISWTGTGTMSASMRAYLFTY